MSMILGTSVATTNTTGNSIAVQVASVSVGALNILDVSTNSTGTGVQPSINTPAGWTKVGGSWKTGSPSHEIATFYRFFQAGDSSQVIVSQVVVGNLVVIPTAYTAGDIDPNTPIVAGEAAFTTAAGPTVDVTSAITLGGPRIVRSVFGNRSGGSWSNATDANVHDPIVTTYFQVSAASLALCSSGATATSNGAARSLTSSASTSINNVGIYALNPKTASTAASGSASLSLSGSADAASSNTAAASLSLFGTSAPPSTTASAVLALSASTAVGSPGAGTAAINLSAAVLGAASGGANAALSLAGIVTAATRGVAAGALALSASAVGPTFANASAALSLFASNTIAASASGVALAGSGAILNPLVLGPAAASGNAGISALSPQGFAAAASGASLQGLGKGTATGSGTVLVASVSSGGKRIIVSALNLTASELLTQQSLKFSGAMDMTAQGVAVSQGTLGRPSGFYFWDGQQESWLELVGISNGLGGVDLAYLDSVLGETAGTSPGDGGPPPTRLSFVQVSSGLWIETSGLMTSQGNGVWADPTGTLTSNGNGSWTTQ